MLILKRLVKWMLWCIVGVHILIVLTLLYWRFMPVERTMFMHIYQLTETGPAIEHQWITYEQMGRPIKQALIAAEDAKFSMHHGFDFSAMKRAAQRNDKKGKIVRGGSTISQQLAKNLFLYNKRSYVRKLEEAFITAVMEAMWPKQRILEVYLNSIEFGRGIYGIEAAAQHYYHKSASKLTAAEAAQLAGLVPNPKYYQLHRQDAKYKRRVRSIRKYMGASVLPPVKEAKVTQQTEKAKEN